MDHLALTNLLGSLAMVASLALAVVGLPQQVLVNYRRKSCEGLSAPLVCSVVCTYGLWSAYGWVKPDIFLGISQSLGLVFALALLIQLLYYRRKR